MPPNEDDDVMLWVPDMVGMEPCPVPCPDPDCPCQYKPKDQEEV